MAARALSTLYYLVYECRAPLLLPLLLLFGGEFVRTCTGPMRFSTLSYLSHSSSWVPRAPADAILRSVLVPQLTRSASIWYIWSNIPNRPNIFSTLSDLFYLISWLPHAHAEVLRRCVLPPCLALTHPEDPDVCIADDGSWEGVYHEGCVVL